MQHETFRLDPWAGSEINQTIRLALAEATTRGAPCAFAFNEVEITVHADSDPKLIYRDFMRAMSGYIGKVVGPYPASELSADEQASDARIEAENEARRAAAQAAYDAKQKTKADAFAAETAGHGFTFAPGGMEEWSKGLDAQESAYGKACFSYAEAWGRLMEARMAAGASVADVAKRASHDADIEGITGFMYGCAVSILARVWRHGEALRQWHNLDTQVGTEGERANESGGVLNPALLSIGAP